MIALESSISQLDSWVREDVEELEVRIDHLSAEKQNVGEYQVKGDDVNTTRVCFGPDLCLDAALLQSVKDTAASADALCCISENKEFDWDDNAKKKCLPRGDWYIQDLGLGNAKHIHCKNGAQAVGFRGRFERETVHVTSGEFWDTDDGGAIDSLSIRHSHEAKPSYSTYSVPNRRASG